MGLALNDFFAELDRFEDRVPLGILTGRLKELEIGSEDDREARRFGRHVYSPALMVMGTYSLTGTERGELRDPVFALADGAGN